MSQTNYHKQQYAREASTDDIWPEKKEEYIFS